MTCDGCSQVRKQLIQRSWDQLLHLAHLVVILSACQHHWWTEQSEKKTLISVEKIFEANKEDVSYNKSQLPQNSKQ